jgi:thioredoxin 1
MKEVDEKSFDSEVMSSPNLVVVDFWATWCGPCRTLLPIMEEISSEMSGVDIVKVDASANMGIARKYGINQIPCLVAIKFGSEVARLTNPAPSKEDIIGWIKSV